MFDTSRPRGYSQIRIAQRRTQRGPKGVAIANRPRLHFANRNNRDRPLVPASHTLEPVLPSHEALAKRRLIVVAAVCMEEQNVVASASFTGGIDDLRRTIRATRVLRIERQDRRNLHDVCAVAKTQVFRQTMKEYGQEPVVARPLGHQREPEEAHGNEGSTVDRYRSTSKAPTVGPSLSS
jgi:hypothetical protein